MTINVNMSVFVPAMLFILFLGLTALGVIPIWVVVAIIEGIAEATKG